MSSEPGIQLRGVSVRYGARLALDAVDLAAMSGEIYCLMGPNGAGKTTVMRLVAGLALPTEGDAWIGSTQVRSPDIYRVRRALGHVPQEPTLYDDLTGREFLAFLRQLYRLRSPLSRLLRERISRLGLERVMDTPMRAYSAGTKKKVAVVASLVSDPMYWALDEPFTSLDALGARFVEEEMSRIRSRGGLVLVTTHDTALVERVADRVGILGEGRRLFEGTLDAFRTTFRASPAEVLSSDISRVANA